MVDARQLSRVLDQAASRRAKVILFGDPDQLKPIGPGDAFRGLLEQTPRPASTPSAARPSPGSVRRPRTSPAAT
jgi:ATP-dependent exoDNAse (exonuclease V) alpha subunit